VIILKIKVEKIKVPEERARSKWTPEQKTFLEAGMQKYGQLSDVLVRPIGDGEYELIDGESRLFQLIAEGKTSIECQVVKLNDKDANMVNILMNVARGKQDPMGMSMVFGKAIDSGMSKDDIALATGHTAQWVDFMIQLSTLPEVFQEALKDGRLKVTHIREACRLSNPKEIDAVLQTTLNLGWNTSNLAHAVQNRLLECAVSEAVAKKTGVSAPPPAIDPVKLSSYFLCLVCGEQVEKQHYNLPRQCSDCYSFSKYAVSVCGKGEEGMQKLFKSLEMMESFDQQRRMFLQQEEARKIEMVPQQPVPKPEPQILEKEDTISKPDNMTDEEWATLKRRIDNLPL